MEVKCASLFIGAVFLELLKESSEVLNIFQSFPSCILLPIWLLIQPPSLAANDLGWELRLPVLINFSHAHS